MRCGRRQCTVEQEESLEAPRWALASRRQHRVEQGQHTRAGEVPVSVPCAHAVVQSIGVETNTSDSFSWTLPHHQLGLGVGYSK